MSRKSFEFYNRRCFLRSSSACIALPFLPSLSGSSLFAADSLSDNRSLSKAKVGSPKSSSGIPKRLIFLPMGYGVNAQNWFPSSEQAGSNYDLPPLVEPFEEVKGDISFIQNLQCARISDPHSGSKNFLTCTSADLRAGGSSRSGVSCDQLAAEVLGRETRFSPRPQSK